MQHSGHGIAPAVTPPSFCPPHESVSQGYYRMRSQLATHVLVALWTTIWLSVHVQVIVLANHYFCVGLEWNYTQGCMQNDLVCYRSCSDLRTCSWITTWPRYLVSASTWSGSTCDVLSRYTYDSNSSWLPNHPTYVAEASIHVVE